MKKQLVYIVFFLSFIGFAQENPVSIAADTTAIRIGEQIQYNIKVNNTENVIFPKLQLDSLKKVEVVEELKTDTLKTYLLKKYLLTSFDSGQYVIPRQQVVINNKKFLTDSLLINVVTVKVDTTKQNLFPIKAIQDEPYTFDDAKPYLWWVLLVLLVIGAILYFIFRKKKVKDEVAAPSIPPIEIAIQRLKELDDKQLWQNNKIKAYYVELTDILRTYVEDDLNIPALESTTDELIETITDFNQSSKMGVSKETIANLSSLLKTGDLVKFAKAKPIANEIEGDRNSAEYILKELKPKKTKEDEVE